MNLFFDTSALIKRYINETGSKYVDDLFFKADRIFISPITEIECISTLKRLQIENQISMNDYIELKKEIREDFKYFSIIEFSGQIIEMSIKLIGKYQLKTLDSIQLASVLSVKEEIDNFVVSDSKLKTTGNKEQLHLIDPQNEVT